MKYNFDRIIARTHTASYKWDQSEVLFGSSDIIPMWVADMDFESPPEVVRAIAERAEKGIYGYTIKPDTYYQAIMDWVLSRHQWEVRKEWILSSPGVVPALSLLITAFTKPGDGVLLQSPVYYPFFSVIEMNDRVIADNPLQEADGIYRMDLQELERKFRDDNVKLMLLCNPHNPSGRVWTKEELVQLGELCEKYDVLIVSDEIHCDLILPGGGRHIPMASISGALAARTVTCMAPSKTFNLAGLQSATVIIPNPSLRRVFQQRLRAMSLDMENYFGVTAMETAYRQGEPWLEELLQYLDANLKELTAFFEARIPSCRVIKPQGTYLVWVDCRKLGLDVDGIKRLMHKQAGVAFNEGSTYGKAGEGFVRINIACPRELMLKGLRRFADAVDRHLKEAGA